MTRKTLASLCLPIIVLLGSGCATNSPTGPVHDPYEGFNRGVYRFNDALDRGVLVPVAKGYRLVTPDFIERGVTNVFNNLEDVTDIANALLQGKFGQAANDGARVVVNTTAGLLGLFDAATRIGLAKNYETFGQTLGVWGVGEGPFLMLPLLGPSNGRDTVGRVPDATAFSPAYWLIDDVPTGVGLTAANVISTRARLLSAGNLLNQAALDPYLLLRDFWVQRHREATVDGREPVAIGLPANLRDDGGALDELDELDELDALDGTDELDELDALDALDDPVEPDQLDALDALDELDELDALEGAGDGTGTQDPVDVLERATDELDELDELDRLDALD